MNHNAYLYSFANAKEAYRPVEYIVIDLATSTIDTIKHEARYLMSKSQDVQSVWLVPPRPNMAYQFHTALKNPTAENCIPFKSYIEEIGIKII